MLAFYIKCEQGNSFLLPLNNPGKHKKHDQH